MEPVVAVQPVKAPPEPMAQKQSEAIASQLQEFLSSNDRDIEFRVDADTKAQVVTVRDARSGEVIRQFPRSMGCWRPWSAQARFQRKAEQ